MAKSLEELHQDLLKKQGLQNVQPQSVSIDTAPQQQNGPIDYFSRDFGSPMQPQQMQQQPQEDGYLAALGKGFASGNLGVLQGEAGLGQLAFNTDGEWVNKLNTLNQQMQRQREWSFDDIKNDFLGYVTNPSGLTYGVANQLGSSAQMMAQGALLASALPASALTGIAGAIGMGAKGLSAVTGGRLGANFAGKTAAEILKDPTGRVLVYDQLGKWIESMSEGGSAGSEKWQESGDIDEGRATAAKNTLINMAILNASGLLETNLLADAIGKLGKKGATADLIGDTILNAIQQAGEEGTQNESSLATQGKTPYSNIVQPWNWQPESIDQAVEAGLLSPLVGGITAGGIKMVGGNKQQQENVQPEQDNSQQQPKYRPTPIAEGIEDEGLANTNPELKNGVDALNEWAYNNFGKDMLISGGARSEQHNREVNGSPTSHHLTGNALDIDLSNFSEVERNAILEQAKAMGFNSDGEDMFHDRGTGLHMHLILPNGGKFNDFTTKAQFANLEDRNSALEAELEQLSKEIEANNAELDNFNKAESHSEEDFVAMDALSSRNNEINNRIEEITGQIEDLNALQDSDNEFDIEKASERELKARHNYSDRQAGKAHTQLENNYKAIRKAQTALAEAQKKNNKKNISKQQGIIENLQRKNSDLLAKLRQHSTTRNTISSRLQPQQAEQVQQPTVQQQEAPQARTFNADDYQQSRVDQQVANVQNMGDSELIKEAQNATGRYAQAIGQELQKRGIVAGENFTTPKQANIATTDGKRPQGNYSEEALRKAKQRITGMSDTELQQQASRFANVSDEDKVKQLFGKELARRGISMGEGFTQEANDSNIATRQETPLGNIGNQGERAFKGNFPGTNQSKESYKNALIDKYKGNPATFEADYATAVNSIRYNAENGNITQDYAKNLLKNLKELHDEVIEPIRNNGVINQGARKKEKAGYPGNVYKGKALPEGPSTAGNKHINELIKLRREQQKSRRLMADKKASKLIGSQKTYSMPHYIKQAIENKRRLAEEKADAISKRAVYADMKAQAEQYIREAYPNEEVQGCKAEKLASEDGLKELLQSTVDKLAPGMGNGVTNEWVEKGTGIVADVSDLKGKEERKENSASYEHRFYSNNDPWYQKWFKEYGRKPSNKELYEIAREIYTGEDAHDTDYGPIDDGTKAAADDIRQAKADVEYFENLIQIYDELEDKFKKEEENEKKANDSNSENNEPEEAPKQESEADKGAETTQTKIEEKPSVEQIAEPTTSEKPKQEETVAQVETKAQNRSQKDLSTNKGKKKKTENNSVNTQNKVGTENMATNNFEKQVAYHVSPKKFDKFDLSYLGNGIGKQAGGYGVYLAKDKRKATEQKDKRNWVMYEVKAPNDNELLVSAATFKNQPENVQKALVAIQEEIGKGELKLKINDSEAEEWVNIFKKDGADLQLVMDTLDKVARGQDIDAELEALAKQLKPNCELFDGETELDSKVEMLRQGFDYWGENGLIFDFASKGLDLNAVGGTIYGQLRKLLGGEKQASEMLDKHGIKGSVGFNDLFGDTIIVYNADNAEIVSNGKKESGKTGTILDKIDFGSEEQAKEDLLEAMGLKMSEKKKAFNVVDDSDEALDAAIKDLMSELSKLSANPMFNPNLYRASLKIGLIYFQRGLNNFTAWSKAVLSNLGNNADKMKPFLGAVYKSVEAYPKEEKFNDKAVEASARYVANKFKEGITGFNGIYVAAKNDFGAENAEKIHNVLQAAYTGINELANPTLKLEEQQENVAEPKEEAQAEPKAEEKQEPQAEEKADVAEKPEEQANETVEEAPKTNVPQEHYRIKLNDAQQGIELYFDGPIDSKVKAPLKDANFKFTKNGGRARWYASQKNAKAMALAKEWGLTDGATEYDSNNKQAPAEPKPQENTTNNTENVVKSNVGETERYTLDNPKTKGYVSAEIYPNFVKWYANPMALDNGLKEILTSKGVNMDLGKVDSRGWRVGVSKTNKDIKELLQALDLWKEKGKENNNADTRTDAEAQGNSSGSETSRGGLRSGEDRLSTRSATSQEASGGLGEVTSENVQGAESTRSAERESVPSDSSVQQRSGRAERDNADDGREDASSREPSSMVGGSRRGTDGGTGTVKGSSHIGENYHIDNPDALLGGDAKVRFLRNKKAIEIVNSLIDEGRKATEEEKAYLAAYSGWGSFGQELFQGTWERPVYKAGWEEENKWLREHLGKEQWQSAQESITNAFFTDPYTVKSIWDMISKMGFKGGRVLEPSMGVGNFFALMPKEIMAQSKLTGIELDKVTGRMAEELYPNANIQIKGYQDSKTADNFYDLIVGNVPFGETGPSDRRYNKFSPNLHDYFFLKGIDQLRPGGLMVAITSKGTMDKSNRTVRAELAKKAELVSAFRLPTGAFDNYAGTDVVTDILIFKKRDKEIGNEAFKEPWVDTEIHETYYRGDTKNIYINKYFEQNPQNVLGKSTIGSGQFGPTLKVERQADYKQQLETLNERLAENTYQPSANKEEVHYISNHTGEQQGSLVNKDGKLYVVEGDVLAPAENVQKFALKDKTKTQERVDALNAAIELRGTLGKLIDADNQGTEEAEKLRKLLNKQYDAFVAKYGKIRKSWAVGTYLSKIKEPSADLLCALENDNGQKATIFKQSTVRTAQKIENPTIQDAFVLQRNMAANVDVQKIAEMAKTTPEKVVEELTKQDAIFKTPAGNYETKDQYLGGNVRVKLHEAEDALANGDKDMERNVEALQKVIPATVPYYNIEVNLGASWIPPEVYKQFIAEKLGLPNTKGIEVMESKGGWDVKFADRFLNYSNLAQSLSGGDLKFSDILYKAFNHQKAVVKKKDSEGAEYIDEKATAKAQAKIDEIAESFKDWLWQSNDRKAELEKTYNEAMNSIATPKYDGSFMRMEGMALLKGNNQFNLRQHQLNAIYRGIVNRRGIYAHEVGTGKTYTMGGLAVESRRYGIAKKPLILAHNANSKQVYDEISEMYPGRKFLYIDNLDKATINRKLNQIKVDDWDAVIIPHSQLDKLTLKEETLMELAQAQIAELEDAAIQAAQEDGEKLTIEKMDEILEADMQGLKGKDRKVAVRSVTAKNLVNQRNKIIENIKKQSAKSSREDALPFEDLGIDMLIVDEAHVFKKPPFTTKMKMKGLNGSTSQQGIRLNFLCEYLQSINNGTGVHLFTGTPITNTLVEMYHMMKYVMPQELRQAGIHNFDRWFNVFAAETNDLEVTSTGEYENVARLASFTNVPELRRMAGNVMDIVFADDMPEFKPRETASGKTLDSKDLTEAEHKELLNGRTENAVGRPYKKIVNIEIPLDNNQQSILSYLVGLAKDWKQAGKKQRKEWMQKGDEHMPIRVETSANNAGMDARLFNPNLPGSETSKEQKCVENVIDVFRQGTKDKPAVQAIFMERGFNSTSTRTVSDASGARVKQKVERFNLAKSLKAKIAEAGSKYGLTEDKIVIIDGSTKPEDKKRYADMLAKGELYVVIGSTQTLGTGVNMQANLRAMHHLDAPWTPAELEQRNGRGHRQGNKWNTVLELRYLTEKLDGKRWQVLSIKQRFIKMFMKADEALRTIEGDAVDMNEGEAGNDLQETLSKATGDPRIMLKAKYENDIKRLQQKERIFVNGIAELKNNIQNAKRTIVNLGKQLETAQQDAKAYAKVKDEPFRIELPKSLAPNGDRTRKIFDKPGEANEHLQKILKELTNMSTVTPIGSYKGFTLSVVKNVKPINEATGGDLYQYDISITGKGDPFRAKDSINSITSVMRNQAEQRADNIEKDIKQRKEQLAIMEKNVNATFPQEESLNKRKQLLADLEKDLHDNPTPAPDWLTQGAPVDSEIYYNGERYVVTGHKATADGYYVTGTNDKGETLNVPYQDAKDEHNMELYDSSRYGKSPEYGLQKVAKETQVLYNKVLAKFDKDGELSGTKAGAKVREAIQATLDFGSQEGEIEQASEALSANGGNADTNRKSNSRPVRQKPKLSKTVGFGITRELVNEGVVSLVGKTINSVQDLAEYAQVLRHPGYEKFHRVYVDHNGKIIGHDTVSSMLPAESSIMAGDKSSRERYKAEWARYVDLARDDSVAKVYVIHNHPSEDPTPSEQDVGLTKYFADNLGDTFGGHIILDTTKYSLLNGTEKEYYEAQTGNIPDNKQVKYTNTGVPHPLLGKKVTGQEDYLLAKYAKEINDSSTDTLYFLDAKMKCRAVVAVSKEVARMNDKQLAKYLEALTKKHYSAFVIPVTSDPFMYGKYSKMFNQFESVLDVLRITPKRADVSRSAYQDVKDRNSRQKGFFGKSTLVENANKVRPKALLRDTEFDSRDRFDYYPEPVYEALNVSKVNEDTETYKKRPNEATAIVDLKDAASKILPIKASKVQRHTEDMYDPHAKVGLISNNGDVTALAGIVGMYIDREKSITKANKGAKAEILSKAWSNAQESMDAAQLQRFSNLSDSAKIRRGVASFMRQYARDKSRAEQEYPTYYKAFETMINQPRNMKLKEKLDNFVNTVQKYEGMSDIGKAQAGMSAERIKEPQTFTEKAKEYWHKVVYPNMFDDKDVLQRAELKIQEITGEVIKTTDSAYVQARIAGSSAANRITMLIQGPNKASNKKQVFEELNKQYGGAMKHQVFFKDVVDKTAELEEKAKTDAKLQKYLADNHLENWEKALGTLLLAKRFKEIWKTKPNYVASMTRQQADEVIQSAPKELNEATELYYKFDENLLRIMKHEGLLNEKSFDALMQYENYCPLFRDFADEAAYDKYMSKLGGMNSYANINNGIKYLTETGSDRTVQDDPVMSMMRMSAAIISKCENNKVAQKLVALSKNSGVGEFIKAEYDAEGKQKHTANAQESVFTVYEDGVQNAYRTTPEIYEVLNGNGETAKAMFDVLDSIAGWTARRLRQGATISPGFVTRNLIKDTLSAGINSKNGFIPIFDTIRGGMALKNDAAFRAQFEASGASMASYFRQDREGLFKTLDEMAGHDKHWYDFSYISSKVGRMLQHAWDKYMEIGELVENATRAGEYLRAIENGKTDIEAAMDAKEITLDFSRGGKYGRKLNRIIPFFNAVMQGGDKTVRTFRDQPVRSLVATSAMALASIALWSLYHDDDWYKELDDETKFSAWHIPFVDSDGKQKYISIPLPQEYGLLTCGSVVAALEQMNGQNPKAMNSWARQFLWQMSPSFIPTIFRPVLECVANYDFYFQSPVESQKYQKLASEARYNNNTPELAKMAANTEIAKAIGLSPIKIMHLVRGYFGTAGSFLASVPNGMLAENKTPAKYWNEMPYIGDFIKSGFEHSKSVTEWYALKRNLDEYHTTYEHGQKPAYMTGANKINSEISKIRKQITAIRESNLPGDRKRHVIDNLEMQAIRLARIGLQNFSKYQH